MVYPNSECAAFCYWMLNTSWQELTNPRKALIQSVYNAAIAGNSVTDTTFNNFTQVTAWRLTYYEAYLKSNSYGTTLPNSTPDFWFRPCGLRPNITNSFGVCLSNGLIKQLNDYLGSSITATQAVQNRYGFLAYQPINSIPNFNIGCNYLASTDYAVNNAANIAKNVSGYTIIATGQNINLAAARFLVFISTGTSATTSRLALYVETTGLWTAACRRLDADSATIITAGNATTSKKIVAVTFDFNNSIGNFYENGVNTVVNQALGTTGNTSNTASLDISICGKTSSNSWDGSIGDIICIPSVLSPAQILAISDFINAYEKCY